MTAGAAGENDGTNAKVNGGADLPPMATYADRLGDISKWAVGALAAVGGAAVTKLSLDRLGKGDADGAWMIWAYAGLVFFAVGVATLVAAVVWHARAGRVTVGYLLSDGNIAKKINAYFTSNSYLLGGQDDLQKFRDRLTALVKAPRPLSTDDGTELRRLLAARATILETARAERARYVNARATAVIVVAAIVTTVGAATFALATNRDQVLRDDKLARAERDRADVVGGTLRPDTPSAVLLVVPGDAQTRVAEVLGAKCELSGAKALLLETASPPTDARQPVSEPSVFHVVSERSPECAVRDLWVPPSWVIPRPEKTEPDETKEPGAPKPADGSSTTTTVDDS